MILSKRDLGYLALPGGNNAERLKQVALYDSAAASGLQVQALTKPAEFITAYEEFLQGAIDIFYAKGGSLKARINNIAESYGYREDVAVLEGIVVIAAIEKAIDSFVGRKHLDEAIGKIEGQNIIIARGLIEEVKSSPKEPKKSEPSLKITEQTKDIDV